MSELIESFVKDQHCCEMAATAAKRCTEEGVTHNEHQKSY